MHADTGTVKLMPTREFRPVDSKARQKADAAAETASTAASTAGAAQQTANSLSSRVAKLEGVRRVRVSLPALPAITTTEVAVSWSQAVLPAGTVVVNATLETTSATMNVSISVKAGSVSASGCTLLVRNNAAPGIAAGAVTAHITAAVA